MTSEATIEFFRELGLELEGRATIEGEWAGRVTGLGDQRVEIAMMRTPDGHSRLELSRFLTPPAVADHRNAPVNALGYLRVMFAVDDIDETLERLRKRGAQLVGEVVQYKTSFGCATSAGLKGFSSDSPRNSARNKPKETANSAHRQPPFTAPLSLKTKPLTPSTPRHACYSRTGIESCVLRSNPKHPETTAPNRTAQKPGEGKARSSGNGNRHNLTGSHIILLSTEDPVEFLHHEQEYLNRFQPIDGVERDLVRKLIAASWREKRMDVMEGSLLELEMQKQSPKIAREFEFIGGETRQTLGLLGTEDVREAWIFLALPGRRPPFVHQRIQSSQGTTRRPLQQTTSISGSNQKAVPTRANASNSRGAARASCLSSPVSAPSFFTIRNPQIIEIPTEPERAIPASCSVPIAA